jgi:hypothetical protein
MEIIILFRQLNIFINKNYDNKNNLFSPIHFKLGCFILCLEEKNSFNKIFKSFNEIKPKIKNIDYNLLLKSFNNLNYKFEKTGSYFYKMSEQILKSVDKSDSNLTNKKQANFKK